MADDVPLIEQHLIRTFHIQSVTLDSIVGKLKAQFLHLKQSNLPGETQNRSFQYVLDTYHIATHSMP